MLIPKISYSQFKEPAIMVSEKEEVELCAVAVCVCAFMALVGHEIIFIKELDCKIRFPLIFLLMLLIISTES